MSWSGDELLLTFPITIVPLDDKAPLLIANLETAVHEGGIVQIGADRLSAADSDSDAVFIKFVVTKQPAHGKLVKKVATTMTTTTTTKTKTTEGENEWEVEVTSFSAIDVSS